MERPDDATLAAWRALLEANRCLTDALDADLRRAHDLPLEWYDVLFQLHDHGGRLRMSELADRLLISRSNCTRLIDRMARSGLVERLEDPTDARGRHAALTPTGRRRFHRAAPTHLAGIATRVGRPLADSGVAAADVATGLCAIVAATRRASDVP